MRTRRALLVLVVTAGGVAACTPAAPARETAADSAAIRALGDTFKAAWDAGDGAALALLVTDDYNATEPDGAVIAGRAAYETMAKTEGEARKGRGMALDIMPGQISFLTPTTATSVGMFALKGLPPGGGPDKGSYLVVSVKGADGQWRVRNSLAAAFVPPPPAPPPKPPK